MSTEDLEYIENSTGKYYVPKDAEQDWVVNVIRQDTIFDSHILEKIIEMYSGGSILDVGSNFGQLSVQFNKFISVINEKNQTKYGVFSFEANPIVFRCLKLNLDANFNSKRLIFGAVWNKVGDVAYFPYFDKNHEVTYGSYNINFSGDGFPVSTITIDSLNLREKIGAIKIDIQGADLRALEGGLKTIERNRPFICTEFEGRFSKMFGDCYSDYLYFIKSIGYKIINAPSLDTVIDDKFHADLYCVPAEKLN